MSGKEPICSREYEESPIVAGSLMELALGNGLLHSHIMQEVEHAIQRKVLWSVQDKTTVSSFLGS